LENQSAIIFRAIESAFGIRLSEDDIHDPRSLGDLAEYLRGRLPVSSHAQLENAAISWRLRIGLREACGIAPATISDGMRLDALLPRAKRQNQWNALEDASQLTLPSLTHPRWFAIGLLAFFLLSMGLAVGFFWSGWSMGQRLFALIATPFWPFMLWWMSLYFSRGLARSFPSDCQTFKDLVREAARINPMELATGSSAANDENAATDDLVWKLLQALIAAETGRELKNVTPHTQLSEIL
jgi:hypothetical protein